MNRLPFDAEQRLKDQMLIVLLKRLGDHITVPISELDDTGQDILEFEVDQKARHFVFKLRKKS